MRGLLVGCALCGVLALPSAASADVWVGKTRQGLRGVVETNPDGSIKVIKVKYRVRCARRGFTFDGRTDWQTTEANPIERNGNAFSDSGQSSGKLGRGYAVTANLTLAGRFLADGRVTVRHTTDATVTLRGRPFDRCRGTVRFVGRKR
jgi:hypothetical protein